MGRTADQISFDDGERFARKEALFRLRQQEVAALRKIASGGISDELRERLTRIEGMMAGLAAHLTAFTADMRKSREADRPTATKFASFPMGEDD